MDYFLIFFEGDSASSEEYSNIFDRFREIHTTIVLHIGRRLLCCDIITAVTPSGPFLSLSLLAGWKQNNLFSQGGPQISSVERLS